MNHILNVVFENDLVELDAAATLAAAEANEHTLITAETRRLQLAAHWADLHVRREALFDRLEVRDLHRRPTRPATSPPPPDT